eukprot:jgi/Bigna1/83217/fgenesh1_pg.104_\
MASSSSAPSRSITVSTELGNIRMSLRADAAPETCECVVQLCSVRGYISKIVAAKAYDGCSFYRSDFVIQMGLSTVNGKTVKNPLGKSLSVNESKLPNTRGAVAIAHWDCVKSCGSGCRVHAPDCGGSEFFINLKRNAHLDKTWGGYCVFAVVDDDKSMGELGIYNSVL